MDQSKSRSSRPRRPATRSVGSAHVIDLRQKSSSFEPAAPAEPKPTVVKKKPPHPQPVPQASPPISKPAPAPTLKQPPAAETYVDAAFPTKARFWPAFWRFLFLLILLGLIITLGIYIYFSYYQK